MINYVLIEKLILICQSQNLLIAQNMADLRFYYFWRHRANVAKNCFYLLWFCLQQSLPMIGINKLSIMWDQAIMIHHSTIHDLIWIIWIITICMDKLHCSSSLVTLLTSRGELINVMVICVACLTGCGRRVESDQTSE